MLTRELKGGSGSYQQQSTRLTRQTAIMTRMFGDQTILILQAQGHRDEQIQSQEPVETLQLMEQRAESGNVATTRAVARHLLVRASNKLLLAAAVMFDGRDGI